MENRQAMRIDDYGYTLWFFTLEMLSIPLYGFSSNAPEFMRKKHHKQLYNLKISSDYHHFIENITTTEQIHKIDVYKHGQFLAVFFKSITGQFLKGYQNK